MAEFKPIIRGIAHGMKDCLVGMTAVLKLDQTLAEMAEEKRRKIEQIQRHHRTTGHERRKLQRPEARKESLSMSRQILSKTLQCCLLNGGIFWMSIFLFENVFIPGLQFVTYWIFKLLSGDSALESSYVWHWMRPAVSCLFSALWVLPLYWLSKPLNSLWFQEIADIAYRKTRGRPPGFSSLVTNVSLSSYIGKIVADFSFSVLLQTFFLIQASLVGFLPIVGSLASLVHMCLLYSLYTFEYKWVNMGWKAPKRLSYVESNWPYFVGFGLPLALLTSLPSSFVISGCVFAILFPLFIVSGNEAEPLETEQFNLKVFCVVVCLTNKVFTRQTARANQAADQPQSPDETS